VLLSAIDLVVALCLAAQFALAAYFLSLLYWGRESAGQSGAVLPAEAELPRVLVQIPVYNEPMVVERALLSAGRLDWPRDRLKIQLLDDSDDLTSDIAVHAIARLRKEGIDANHVRRADRSGFKAGALAAGMALCDAPYVAVFDADFVAAPDWLRRAMAPLLAEPRAAFVQTRIEWGNGERNWLTRAQRLMQDAHFAVEQDVRARRGLPFQFNGTGGIWRRSAVDDAGGWSHDTLSEDLDLVLRTHLKGWSGIFLMEPHVVGELPQRLEDFGAQQSRWSKGFMEVARKLLPQVWAAAWPIQAKLTTTVVLGQQLVFPALVVGTVALILSIVGHGHLIGLFRILLAVWLVAMLAVLFGMTWAGYRRLRRGGVARYGVTALSVPALVVYLAIANAGAIIGAAFGRKSEFNRTPKTGT
jgi:cellulose synthase/poly-beta-1,6-N-acetylglucosamine synthase-like glycosyltransferase